MNPQLYYWETFTTVKRDTIYISLLVEKLDHTERCLNMIAAMAASTAIAGWAIWQHYSWVWACVIAASQVYTAIKNHLPFGARLRAFNSLYPELESITMEAERGWFDVSRGLLDDTEIIDLATKLKRQKIQATQTHLKGIVAPEKEKIAKTANATTTAYMGSFMEV